jgi:hypothetical protein
MAIGVFLSCVSNEFRSYRLMLTQRLLAMRTKVYAQELLQNRGGRLIDLLDDDIQKADWVVHLVGEMSGERPPREIVDYVLGAERFRSLSERVGWTAIGPQKVDPYGLSYTQWEYWLGRYRGKKSLVFLAISGKDPVDQSQSAHLQQIRSHGLLRDRVSSEWQLLALVLQALLNLSGEPAAGQMGPDPAQPPAIILRLTTAPSGHLLTGGVRVGDRLLRLGDPVQADVTNPAVVAGAFSNAIDLARIVLGEKRPLPVVELALPAELLFRPSTDWRWYPHGGRSGEPEPIRNWFPLRLRVADRASADMAVENLRRRLALLQQNGSVVTAVYRAVPAASSGPDSPPFAVLHDPGTRQPWWQYDGAVCGGFTDPPAARAFWTPLWRRSPPVQPIREAAEFGVPFLIWPEGEQRSTVRPSDLQAQLRETRPDRLCYAVRTFASPFAVLAESAERPLTDGPPLVSDLPPPETPS